MRNSIADYDLNTSRARAELAVDKFNRSCPVGTRVTYLKSQIEGKLVTTVNEPAYVLGDDFPVAVLNGIETAALEKIEKL